MKYGIEEQKKRGIPAWLLLVLMVLVTAGVLYGIKRFIIGDSAGTTEDMLRRTANKVFGQEDYRTERRPYRALSSLPSSGGVSMLDKAGRSGRYASAAGGRYASRGASSAREREFIRRHDKEIKKYQAYLRRLGQRARAKYPAVRAMDSDFARMDRYMALKRQYDRDRDPYKWMRGVMALPEVRRAIVHYSRDPEVTRALAEVAMEALSHPPSSAVFNEIMSFICAPEQSGYMTSLSNEVMGGATAGIMAGFQEGQDMTSLVGLGEQISANMRSEQQGRSR